ncbi:hypothetical protein JW916_13620, partial [Candidatus Sumerlaeota bacterium]|nr:hypothetical protein [Candidatus Sumerlaeota bacterium]
VGGGVVGTWTQTTPIPEALVVPAVTVYDGVIYVVGSYNESMAYYYSAHSPRFSPGAPQAAASRYWGLYW